LLRRLFTLLVLCSLAFALAACGGDDDDSATGTTTKSGDRTSTSTADDATDSTDSTSGGSSAGGSESEYAAAIAEVIKADDDFASVSDDDAQCAGDKVASAVGVDTFKRLKVTPASIREDKEIPEMSGELSDEQAKGVTDGLLDCINFGEVLADQLAKSAGYEATDKQVECLNDTVEKNSEFRKAMAAQFTGDDDASQSFDVFGQLGKCVPLDKIMGSATTDGS
jgi:hypothetical protein